MTEPNTPTYVREEEFQEDEIDLREYWRILTKHRRAIIGIVVLTMLFAALVSLAMDPVYRSTATLMIEVNQTKVAPIEEVYGFNPANREYLKTQFEILKSRKLAATVIERLGLVDHPEFAEDEGPGLMERLGISGLFGTVDSPTEVERFERVVELFSEQLSIEPVRNSQLVKINFEAHDPVLARNVANAVAQAFIEASLDAKVQVTREASAWLQDRLEKLRRKLQESESKLRTYIANQPLRRFESLPELINHPVIQRFKEAVAAAERKVSELGETYGPEHPKMIAAREELRAARSSLRREIKKVTAAITADSVGGSREGRALSLDEMLKQLDTDNPMQKSSELHNLQREVLADRQLYNMFLERIKETNLIGDVKVANARVVDPAVLPIKPVKPKKALITGLSGMVALFLAVMLAFLLEYLDNTLKTSEDVEKRLGLPTLGVLPYLKGKGISPEKEFQEHGHSLFAEAIRTVRTAVMLSALDNPHRILMVTSAVPGEGKTTTALNLASALAQLENKVLLLDADMRKPSIAAKLGLDARARGLSELTAGTVPAKECVHPTGIPGLDVIPAGVIPPNPQELLSSKRFAEILNKLAEGYERVVIDTAPANEVSDALIIGARASAVVFVIKADATPYHVAQVGLKKLQQARAHVIGVVLNQLDLDKMKRLGRYGYGIYGGYYHAHGYGQPYGQGERKPKDAPRVKVA